MVFARKSRSDSGAAHPPFGDRPDAAPTARSVGKIVDPFAAEREFPDPALVAEQVVFKLWSDGAVKGRAIEQARREADDKLRLDQALTRLRLADPEPVAAALAAEIDAPLARDRDFPVTPVMPDALPSRFVREALALPLADDGATLVLAMADPLDDYALRAIAMKTRRRLAVKVACAKRLEVEIDRLYRLDAQRALPAPGGSTDHDRSGPPSGAAGRPRRDARPVDGARIAADGARIAAFDDHDRPGAAMRRDENRFEDRRGREPRTAERFDDGGFNDGFKDDGFKDDAFNDDGFEKDGFRDGDYYGDGSQDLGRADPREGARDASDDRYERPRRRSGPSPAARPALSGATPSFLKKRAKPEASKPAASKPEAPRPSSETPRRPERQDAPRREAPPRLAEDLVEHTSRDLARSLERDGDFDDGLAERAAEDAALAAEDAARASSAPIDAPSAPPRPARPKFVRPRRVNLKNKVERASLKDASTKPQPQPQATASARLAAPAETEQSGSIAAQVRAQVAARRAERERAARATGDANRGDENDAPLRFKDINGHASAAKAKTGATRRKVLDEVRKALSGGRAPQPREKPTGGAALRYQAAAALEARGEPVAAAPRRPERPPAQSHIAKLARQTGPDAAAAKTETGLAALAESPEARRALAEATTAEDGLILIAGPSGSGKAATLKTLVSLRAGARVTAARFDEPGAAFPRGEGFRLYWGEIRDAESAEAAARAAMTGALVLATLDATTAAGAAPRLIDLGLPPYALASSLRAVMSQRMEEQLCTRCAGTGRDIKGEPCPECGGEGRVETTRIHEAMILDDTMRALILSDAPEDAYRHAISAGAGVGAENAAGGLAGGAPSSGP